jgi:hypothetical protein
MLYGLWWLDVIIICMIMINSMVMISILMVMIGCTNQPPATLMPTPTLMPTLMPTHTPVPTKVINERVILIDILSTFNKGSNEFYGFLSATTSIEWLEGSTVQKSYIHTLVTIGGLNVYKQTVTLWYPPEYLDTYDVLIEMKEAELYRITRFTEQLQILQDNINEGDIDQINKAYENLEAWADSPENVKSLDIQTKLLKRFDISSEEVNFIWTKPEVESDKDLTSANKGI